MKKQLFITFSLVMLMGTQQACGMEKEQEASNETSSKTNLQPTQFKPTQFNSTLKPTVLKPVNLKPTKLQPKLDEARSNDLEKIKNKIALLGQTAKNEITKANTDYYNNMPSEPTLENMQEYMRKGIKADNALMKNYYSNLDAISSELDAMTQKFKNELLNDK